MMEIESEQDRLLLAVIARDARRLANLLLDGGQEPRDAAAALREIAHGRDDLLAAHVGLSRGTILPAVQGQLCCEVRGQGACHAKSSGKLCKRAYALLASRLKSQESIRTVAASLSVEAGADASMIASWEAEGIKRVTAMRAAFPRLSKRKIHQDSLLQKFWASELCLGKLHLELRVVDRVRKKDDDWLGCEFRDIDGVIVLNEPFSIVGRGKDAATSLEGCDVVLVQASESPLNPYLAGQALLSKDLVERPGSPLGRPRDTRSIAVHVDGDKGKEIESIFEIQTRIMPRHCCYYSQPYSLHEDKSGSLLCSRRAWSDIGISVSESPEQELTSCFKIPGLMIPGLDNRAGPLPLDELADNVRGRDVISLHSSGKRPGMYLAGEVIMALGQLLSIGAATARAVVRCPDGDGPIQEALNNHVTIERYGRVNGWYQLWIRPLNSQKSLWPKELDPSATQ